MKHLLIIALLSASAQAADITIAVTIRKAGVTNRESAQINNTNMAALVIAHWRSLGTNEPARNAVLAMKEWSVEPAKEKARASIAADAMSEVQARIDRANAKLAEDEKD